MRKRLEVALWAIIWGGSLGMSLLTGGYWSAAWLASAAAAAFMTGRRVGGLDD